MTFDDPFEIDFRPAVPATVRAELNKLLRGTTRIVVYEDVAEGKTRKVNGLRLNNKPGAFPKEPLEEIAEAIAAIMQVSWESQETEDPDVGLPPMGFVIVCEQAGKARKRTQFTYVYRGEAEPDFVEDTLSIEERAVHRVLELQERMLDKAYAYIADGNERLLRIVEQNSSQAAAGAQMMQHAIPLFMAGNQQVLNARTLEFSAARAEAQEKATTERIAAALKILGPFVGIGMQQFVAKRFGIEIPTAEAEVDDEHPGPNGRAHGMHAVPDDPQDVRPPEHILAAMANHFGDNLTSRQRSELNRILTKKQLAAFDALFCSSTDAEAYAAYQMVIEHAMDKLGLLQQLLDPEQTEILQAFMQGASQYATHHPPPE